MMKKNAALIITLVFALSSCTEDNESEFLSDADYFPLELENSWTYENQVVSDGVTNLGSETLAITKRADDRFNFTQNVNSQAGVFTSILASGEVYKQNGNQIIVYDGNLNLSIDSNLQNLEFPLEDIIFYDVASSSGDILSSNSGQFQENINGFPIDFSYEITSMHSGFSPSELVSNTTYENVFISELEVSLSATVFLVISDFTILQKQNILSIKNYYAKGVGLIKSEVNTEIIFEDIPEQLDVQISDVISRSTQSLESYELSTDLYGSLIQN